jgi:alpha-tubulin suppressor-like RCC1 family protein
VPITPATNQPYRQGLLGQGLLGLRTLGGSPPPILRGHAILGLSLLGGVPEPAGTNPNVTVTAGLAGVTVTAKGATAVVPGGDQGYYWGASYNSGGPGSGNWQPDTPYAVPTAVPTIGSVPGGHGAVTSLVAEDGQGYWVIGGVVYGFGDNSLNQLNPSTSILYYTNVPSTGGAVGPVNVSSGMGLPGGIVQVDGGFKWGMALDSSNPGGPGTGYLWAWGNATFGSLGNNTGSGPPQTVAEQVFAVGGSAIDPLIVQTVYWSISGAAGHGLAIEPAGTAVAGKTTVASWGRNNFGQIGDNTTIERDIPVRVLTGAQGDPSGFLVDIVFVSVGDYHCVALDKFGQVWTWGRNDGSGGGNANTFGQLGDGTTTQRNTPVLAGFIVSTSTPPPWLPNTITAISGGGGTTTDGQTLVIDSSGQVWSWGCNGQGQLGIGGSTSQTIPQQVTLIGGTPFTADAVWSGGNHGLALKAGQVYAWGDNTQGELGLGTVGGTSVKHPTLVTTFTAPVGLISAGHGMSIADAGTNSNVTVVAGLATVTVSGLGATANAAGNVTVTAGLASVSVTAKGASATGVTNVTVVAGLARVIVSAFQAGASIPAGVNGPFVGRIV